jgi:hypothetical protein
MAIAKDRTKRQQTLEELKYSEQTLQMPEDCNVG